MTFITDDFLLNTKAAKSLYHGHAKTMPIYDFHCHLSVADIADNRKYENITQLWLNGDHYKWRAMRAFGIDEKMITGNAGDYEKFAAWASTVPYTIRNPLYHWTHLELSRYFGIDNRLLDTHNARYIYDKCCTMLKDDGFSTRGLIKRMNVKILFTTDDPTDDLSHHKKIKNEDYEVKVLPTFRPDKAMSVDSPELFNRWIAKLENASNDQINDFDAFLSVLQKRHDYFHEEGCRISDHGLEIIYAEDFTEREIKDIFNKSRNGRTPDITEILKFKSAMMQEFAMMNHKKGWAMQIHIGALRNNNSRMYRLIGPDTGFDSIGDGHIASHLSKFLDKLDSMNCLPKTILYNLNPADNEAIAAMIGNFQDGSIKGKMQFGSAWWFLDQKDGIEKQLNSLSNMGLLSGFVGMVTDSRSFLSYPRHEYFRRILCNIFGNDIENGELPDQQELIGKIIEDICFNNAAGYFGISI